VQQIQLSQKETMFLGDLKSYELLCIQKYGKYSEEAQDPLLRQIFQDLNSREQQHLRTIEQIMGGQAPTMNQGGQGQSQPQNLMQNLQANKSQQGFQSDAYLCNDLLASEKHAADAYNTAIFEFQDTNVRQALNHIQKEEQEHGEVLFNYMKTKGMYNVQ